MKVVVNRELLAGTYYVSFSVTDITAEDKQLLETFGVPTANAYTRTSMGVMSRRDVPITQLSNQTLHKMAFADPVTANVYAEEVLGEISRKVSELRNRQDDFTSKKEVTV